MRICVSSSRKIGHHETLLTSFMRTQKNVNKIGNRIFTINVWTYIWKNKVLLVYLLIDRLLMVRRWFWKYKALSIVFVQISQLFIQLNTKELNSNVDTWMRLHNKQLEKRFWPRKLLIYFLFIRRFFCMQKSIYTINCCYLLVFSSLSNACIEHFSYAFLSSIDKT